MGSRDRQWCYTTTRILSLWCAMVVTTACKDEPTEPEPPPFVPVPATIEVTPESATLTLTDSIVQLTAIVRDQNGDEMEDVTVQWSSANPEIATVNPTGLVAAQSGGDTRISARHDTLVAGSAIEVRTVRVPAAMYLRPLYAILPLPDGVMQLTAIVVDQYGYRIEDKVIEWSSTNPEIATVDATGFVTARSEGSTRVSARHDSVVASTGILVGDDPDRDALTSFYHATGGANWAASTNWLSGQPLSEWHGVATTDSGRVHGLHLPSNALTGEIPPGIGTLSQLRRVILSGNALTGPIPPSIGNFKRLYVLGLSNNGLTGALPAEIVEAVALDYLAVKGNPLSGLLPESMPRLALYSFDYEVTGLCARSGAAFQRWLKDITALAAQPCPAPRHDQLILTELYEALGGSAWSRQDGWLTDAPLAEWAGVSVDANGWVTALDLKDNNVIGKLPYQLVHLRKLARLDVSENRELHGMIPEWMTETDLDTLRFGGTGVCAPPTEDISEWLLDRIDEWSGEECAGAESILADLPLAYLTQPVQNRAAGVPVMAGRDALLRVFALADSINYFDSEAQATFYTNGEAVHVANMTVEGMRGIPLEVDEGRLETSYHALIPGEVLVPGLEMVVELDPDGKLPLRDGSRRRLPVTGTLALDVREMPEMKLTIVPLQFEGEDTSLAAGASRMTTESMAIRLMLEMLPISNFDLSVREVFHVSADVDNLLREIDLLRIADGDPGYYVGIIGRGGAGNVGARASLADTTGTSMAHEMGHNMNLDHAPCGGPQRVDPNFPHEGGRTGAWGRDPETGELKRPNSPDLMSYCTNQTYWISDYSHVKAMEYRLAEETYAARLADDRSRTPSLVLWGRAGPDEVTLDPAIVVDAVPSLPDGGGPYRIEGRSAGGATLFSLSFTPMIEAESGEGHFVFTLPVEAAWAGSLASITLTGPNGSDRLDATVRRPIAIVTDRATGRIRKLLRDFETAPVAGPGEVVTVSWGLPDAEVS